MTKIKTINPILWGGANPYVGNNIVVSLREITKDETGVLFNICDTVLEEKTFLNADNETETVETDLCVIRNKNFKITVEKYNDLYENAEAYIEATQPNLNFYEREKIRTQIALLLFVQNDHLEGTDKCIYGTVANQWGLL